MFATYALSQEKYTVFGFRLAAGGSKMKGIENYEQTQIIPGSSLTTLNPYTSRAGVAYDFGFTIQSMRNKLMIQGDFLFSVMRTRLGNAYIHSFDHLKNIGSYYNNITVNFGTKIPINNDIRFVMGGGPYIGFDMSSWLFEDDSYSKNGGLTSSMDGTLYTDEADYKNFDFGYSILAGFEYGNLQFAINYYHGLYNIVYDVSPLYNRSCKLSFVYFFFM